MQPFTLSTSLTSTSYRNYPAQVPVRVFYLLAFLSRGNVDFGPFLECLPQDLTDQWLAGNLQGHHVAGSFQHGFWGGELAEKCSGKVL